MIDPSLLTTRSEILAQLASLTQHESQLDVKLANLISSRSKLSAQLNSLDGLREVINGIQIEAGHMSSEVGRVAETAERVGGKVRILDEEQVRYRYVEMDWEIDLELFAKVESQGINRSRSSCSRS